MHSRKHRTIVIAAIVVGVALLLVWGIAGHRSGQRDRMPATPADDRADAIDTERGIVVPREDPDASSAGLAGSATDLFKRKVRTLSDPEWNMALAHWAARHPEFEPWVRDEDAIAVASRNALLAEPDATFEALMPQVAALMHAGEHAGTVQQLPVPTAGEVPTPAQGD